MYSLDQGEVLVKVHYYEVHRGEKHEIIHIKVMEFMAGTREDVPRFAVMPEDYPFTFQRVKPEFIVEADTEGEAIKLCLEKVRGVSKSEIFSEKDEKEEEQETEL